MCIYLFFFFVHFVLPEQRRGSLERRTISTVRLENVQHLSLIGWCSWHSEEWNTLVRTHLEMRASS